MFLAIRFPPPKQPQGFPIRRAGSLLADRTLLLLGSMLFFQSGMEITIGGWSAQFAHEALKLERRPFRAGPLALLGRDDDGADGADPVAAAMVRRPRCSARSWRSPGIGSILLLAVPGGDPGDGRPLPDRIRPGGGLPGRPGGDRRDLQRADGNGVQHRLRRRPAGRQCAALPDRPAGRPVRPACLAVDGPRRPLHDGASPCHRGPPGRALAPASSRSGRKALDARP